MTTQTAQPVQDDGTSDMVVLLRRAISTLSELSVVLEAKAKQSCDVNGVPDQILDGLSTIRDQSIVLGGTVGTAIRTLRDIIHADIPEPADPQGAIGAALDGEIAVPSGTR